MNDKHLGDCRHQDLFITLGWALMNQASEMSRLE